MSRTSYSRRREAIVATSLAAHVVAALALLQARPEGRATGDADVTAIVVSLVAAANAAPPSAERAPAVAETDPPSPSPPEPPADATPMAEAPPIEPTSSPAAAEPVSRPAEAASAAAVDLPAGACAIPEAVLAALRDSGADAALGRTPAARRSVANALMLWDGRWVTSGALADPRVARAVRSAVTTAVNTAEPACAQADNTGPTLLLAPDHGGVMVLVIGSGRWRWSDLATPG